MCCQGALAVFMGLQVHSCFRHQHHWCLAICQEPYRAMLTTVYCTLFVLLLLDHEECGLDDRGNWISSVARLLEAVGTEGL